MYVLQHFFFWFFFLVFSSFVIPIETFPARNRDPAFLCLLEFFNFTFQIICIFFTKNVFVFPQKLNYQKILLRIFFRCFFFVLFCTLHHQKYAAIYVAVSKININIRKNAIQLFAYRIGVFLIGLDSISAVRNITCDLMVAENVSIKKGKLN